LKELVTSNPGSPKKEKKGNYVVVQNPTRPRATSASSPLFVGGHHLHC